MRRMKRGDGENFDKMRKQCVSERKDEEERVC